MRQYTKQPLKIRGERVWRTYCGGRELERLYGIADAKDNHFPELWMFSTVRTGNVGREEIEEGVCYLDTPEKISLKSLIEAYPAQMLGSAHTAAHCGAMGVLIKLIDAAERLTVQVHPDQEMAMQLFGSRYGKTECWHILNTRANAEEPCIYIGFREGITRAQWQEVFKRQDYAQMLALLHRVPVKAGETYIIHAGVPHAIGQGCMLIEIQEPTDYTIRVERVTPAGFEIDERMCHQGIGFERMFDCFNYAGVSNEQAVARWRLQPRLQTKNEEMAIYSLVDYDETPCFAMERIEVTGEARFTTNDLFACFYVCSGSGVLEGGGVSLPLHLGDQIFLPADCAEYSIRQEGAHLLTLLRFHGPQ